MTKNEVVDMIDTLDPQMIHNICMKTLKENATTTVADLCEMFQQADEMCEGLEDQVRDICCAEVSFRMSVAKCLYEEKQDLMIQLVGELDDNDLINLYRNSAEIVAFMSDPANLPKTIREWADDMLQMWSTVNLLAINESVARELVEIQF